MSTPFVLECVQIPVSEQTRHNLLTNIGKTLTMVNGRMKIVTNHTKVRIVLRNGLYMFVCVNAREVFAPLNGIYCFWPLMNKEAYSETVLSEIEKMMDVHTYWKDVDKSKSLTMMIYDLFYYKLKHYRDLYNDIEIISQFSRFKFRYEKMMDEAFQRDTWVENVFDYSAYDRQTNDVMLIEPLHVTK